MREHVTALEVAGARAVTVRRPGELAALDGLVLPGGESTTMEHLLHAFGLAEPLRRAVRTGLPVFGSCAGMILLADRVLDAAAGQRTIGGLDVTVRRNAFGRQVDSFEEDLVTSALGAGPDRPPLHAVYIRAPWVEEAGPAVEVLARTSLVAGPAPEEKARPDSGPGPGEAGDGRIVAVRQGRLLATAFHPEIGHDFRVHSVFVDMVRAAQA